MLNCKVKIEINDIDEAKAKAIVEALSPDNVDFPLGLASDITQSSDNLIITFESHDRTGALISSVDEVLEHVSVSMKVME